MLKGIDSIMQKIEDIKNENKKKREEDLKKLQNQKEEYIKEIEQLKKQKDELMLKLNKAEKDINMILNRSAPYQLQILKQISENQNSIKIIQTQNLNQKENFLKTTEKIQIQINQNFKENQTQNQ